MKLIVAEKASVARNIAAALGAEKQGPVWEGDDYLITNCVGHLCALALPEDYDPRLKEWRLEDLPILPTSYLHVVVPSTQRQYELVSGLMQDARVNSIINACDGDREGENIFRLVYRMAQCSKPVERLWVSSMEAGAILEGMKNLRPMADYDRLAEAARCREVADWMIGINGSRAFSRLYNRHLTVGRVQTPTVGLIVKREQEIRSFQPQDYWMVSADLGDFSVSRRCESKEELQKVLKACTGQATISKIERKSHKEGPPVLYNLNTLQQDCSRCFGATAAQTHDALQSLYERQMATYPRTESEYLTTSDRELAEQVLTALLEAALLPPGAVFASSFDLSALIDDNEVNGHPALLPTALALQHLEEQSTLERRILLLLLYRLLEASSPAREYDTTQVEVLIGGYPFTAEGTVETKRGWRSIEDAMLDALALEKSRRKRETLPELDETDTRAVQKCSSKKKQTRPPERYTEAGLLRDMERFGLGTPATRAGILENLMQSKSRPNGLLTRGTQAGGKQTDTQHIYPTKNAEVFLSLLPNSLKTPDLTHQWENQLSDICKDALSGDAFLQSVEQYVRDLVEGAKREKERRTVEFERPKDAKTICACPICGKGSVISSRHRGEGTAKIVFHCTDAGCPMRLSSPLAGRRITEDEVKQLCRDGITPWMEGFVSKKGKSFPTKLKVFKDGSKPAVRMTSLDDLALCDCPVCTGKIVPFHWRQSADTLYEGWQCSEKACAMQRFYNPKYGRMFTEDEVRTLFTDGQIAVPSGMTDINGNPFAAMVCLELDEEAKPTGKIVTKKIKRRA